MLIGADATSSVDGAADLSAIGEFSILDHRILVVPIAGESSGHEGIEIVAGSERFAAAGELRLGGLRFLLIEASQAERMERRDPSEIMTGREMQIARMVALGMPNKQIAFKLHISEWTVATHLRRIFTKLGVDSRAAMVFRCAFDISRSESSEPVTGMNASAHAIKEPAGD